MGRIQRILLVAVPFLLYATAATIMSASYLSSGVPANTKLPMVGSVVSGKPAERAGIQSGDVILSIDGKSVSDTEVAPAIQAGGETVRIEIARGEQKLTFSVAPVDHRIGVEIFSKEGTEQVSAGRAIGEGILFPARFSLFILHAWGEIFVGKQKAEFSGPVGIVKVMQRQDQRHRWTVLAVVVTQLLVYVLCFEIVLLVVILVRRRFSRA